jgi:hypothetical protein
MGADARGGWHADEESLDLGEAFVEGALGAAPQGAFLEDATGVPPPTFDSIRDDVSPALRRRLDALAAAV